MDIYLVRHGETPWNIQRRVQGVTDIPLNEKGIALARQTGKALKHVPFQLAISSPLKRAVDTAGYILEGRGVPVTTDERIIEASFGVMEGVSFLEAEGEAFKENFRSFFEDPDHYLVPEGGESLVSVCRRTEAFLDELLHREEYEDAAILVTSHGCAVRALLQRFYHDDLGFWHGCVPPNCSVNLIRSVKGKARLVKEDAIYY